MKRVFVKRGRYVLGSVMVILTLLLTGCANSGSKKEEMPESISSVEQQESSVIQNTEVKEVEQATEDGLPNQSPTISDENSSSTKPNIQKEGNTVPTEKPVQENNVPAQEMEAKNQTTTEDITSISGYVESVGNGSFVISQINTSKAGDGSDLAIKSKEGSTQITAIYIDTTEFIICSSSDGGKTSSETTASLQDLAIGKHVILEGAWNQNDFTAQKVAIYNFERT